MTTDERDFLKLLTLERRFDGWWGKIPGHDWVGPWADARTACRSIYLTFNVE